MYLICLHQCFYPRFSMFSDFRHLLGNPPNHHPDMGSFESAPKLAIVIVSETAVCNRQQPSGLVNPYYVGTHWFQEKKYSSKRRGETKSVLILYRALLFLAILLHLQANSFKEFRIRLIGLIVISPTTKNLQAAWDMVLGCPQINDVHDIKRYRFKLKTRHS